MVTFVVLPTVDAVSASVIYLAVIIIPTVCDIIDKTVNERRTNTSKFALCDELAKLTLIYPLAGLVLQIAGIVLIALHLETPWLIAVFVVGATLSSIKYWENYVTFGSKYSILLRGLKRDLQRSRTKVTCLTSLWKMLITFLAVITIYSSIASDSTEGFKSLFNGGVSNITSIFGDNVLGSNGLCNRQSAFVVALVNIVCSYLCYKTSKSVCVIFCQRLGFGLPMLVLPIATTGTLIGLMHKPSILYTDSCDLFFSDWYINAGDTLVEKNLYLFIAFILLYLSVALITRHVWKSNGYRHGETSR